MPISLYGLKLVHFDMIISLQLLQLDKYFVHPLQGVQKNLPHICTSHLDPTSVMINIFYFENLEKSVSFE